MSAILSGVLLWAWLAPPDDSAQYKIVRVAVSKSARWIAMGAASGWIGIIDQTNPDSAQRFRGGKGALRDLRFTKDEQWLVVVNNRIARHPVQSLGSLEELGPDGDSGEGQAEILMGDFGERTSNLIAGPDGSVVFGNHAGSIEIHDARTKVLLRRFTFR